MLHRDRRVAELIRGEVAKIIVNELADPHLGFVTVIAAKLTKDLKRATIYVSVIGDDKQQQLTLEHLQHARGHIRNLLRHRIMMRYLPDIEFELDTLMMQEQRVAELIAEIHRQELPPVEPEQDR